MTTVFRPQPSRPMDSIASGLLLGRPQRIAAYAMALGLLAAVTLLFSLTSWNRSVERRDRELEIMVTMGAQGLDTYLSTLEKSLKGLAERIQAQGINAETRLSLAEYKRRYPEFKIIVVYQADGKMIANSEGPLANPAPNLGRSPSYIDAKAHLEKGATMVVSQPLLGTVTNAWTTPLRYGIRDANGKLQFIVGAGLSQDRPEALWKYAPLPPGGAMGVIRDDFFIVARHPLPEREAKNIFTEPSRGLLPPYLAKSGFPAAGVIRGTGPYIDGKVTIAFRRLANYPLTFYVVDPAKHLVLDWWASAWPIYMLILIMFAGGLLITAWVRKRQMQFQAERDARLAELEELTKKLAASNAELEVANGELESFTYTVSHDLRAPIRAIDGYSSLLGYEIEASDKPETHDLLNKVRAATARIAALLDDLLDLSRCSKVALEKVDVDCNRKVASVIEELQANGGKVQWKIDDLPPCRADPLLLRLVWTNLISNAVKYSARAATPAIRIAFVDGAYCVADNGVGFDMAYADKLFRTFSRLHGQNEFAGTGIGLAMVKRIVERHGGRIWATGEEGKGASFYFTMGA